MRGWFLMVVLSAGCAEAEPTYGDPSGILGKKLPGEGSSASASGSDAGVFGVAYDASANQPTTSLATAHAAAPGAPAAGDALDCLLCNALNGAAAAKPFAFGGRVNKATPNIDVVVVLGAQKLGPVKSDAAGFFWLAGSPLAAGGTVSARNAASTSAMSQPLVAGAGGSCDTLACHGSKQPKAGAEL